jgi:hypothetical protein
MRGPAGARWRTRRRGPDATRYQCLRPYLRVRVLDHIPQDSQRDSAQTFGRMRKFARAVRVRHDGRVEAIALPQCVRARNQRVTRKGGGACGGGAAPTCGGAASGKKGVDQGSRVDVASGAANALRPRCRNPHTVPTASQLDRVTAGFIFSDAVTANRPAVRSGLILAAATTISHDESPIWA